MFLEMIPPVFAPAMVSATPVTIINPDFIPPKSWLLALNVPRALQVSERLDRIFSTITPFPTSLPTSESIKGLSIGSTGFTTKAFCAVVIFTTKRNAIADSKNRIVLKINK